MNRHRNAMFLSFLLGAATCAVCAEKAAVDPIDRKLEDCLNHNTTTMGMEQCARWAAAEWDKELNAVYSKLERCLDAKSKAALLKSQRQWLSFRDEEFSFISTYYAGFQGTMYIPATASSKADVIKERTLKLRSYLDELEMKEEARR